MICEENLHGNLSDGPVAISGANHTSSERSSIADILFQALIWMCLKIEILNCSQLGQDDSAAKNITRSRQTVLGQFLGPNTPYLKRYSYPKHVFHLCLDVFENSNFDFFLNSLCRFRLDLNP